MCVFVSLCVNFFFVKDFSGAAVPRILKFGTNIGYDKLYSVLKNQPHMAYQSLYLFIFLSFQFLAHLSRRLRGELIVYQSSRRPSVRACVCASVCSHFQT